MSSLYKKNYIASYRKEYMLDVLEGRTTINLNPTDLVTRSQYIALQHFLIQYIEKHGKNEIVKKVLNKYYEDYKKYPHLFVDSPLVSNGFINRYVSLKDRFSILKVKKEFENEKVNLELNKHALRRNVLSNEQKNKLYSYLLKLLKENKPENNRLLEEHARLILNSNKKLNELNEMEANFYCAYIAMRAGQAKFTPSIHFVRKANFIGRQFNGIIEINKNFGENLELWELTKILCHEATHTLQEMDAHKKVSKRALEMVRYQLFNKYLNSDSYDSYHQNYKYSDIEKDAENYALYYSEILLRTLGRIDLAEKVRKSNTATYNERNFYEIMYNEQGQMISPDAFAVDNLDKIIREHPEEINNYAVLQNIYNKDGTRKPLSTLIARKINEDLKDKEIYDNYIHYAIVQNQLFEIDIPNTNRDVNEKLFKSLGGIYRNKINLLKNYCCDTDFKKVEETSSKEIYEKYKKQVSLTTLYEIQTIDNIISFIDYNIEHLLSFRENNKLTNTSFIYNFIHDLSGFDINKIDNEVIKQDPRIRERIDKLIEKHNLVVKKINKQYIDDRVGNLSIEQKHAIIETPEGYDATLYDYLYSDLLPRITSHADVNINDKNTQLDVVIKYCLNQVSNKKENENVIH